MPGEWCIIYVDVHEVVNFGTMASNQRAYSVTTTLQAFEAAEKSSKEAAARQFGLDQHGSSTCGVDLHSQGVPL